MTENEKVGGDPAGSEEAVSAVASSEDERQRLDQEVQIETVGPCRKHVRVRVPRSDIDRFYEEVTQNLVKTADVPGFRKGRVPAKLVAKRFRREIADEVRQKILIQSLEQLTEDHDLDPINEPDLDVEALEIPEEGDFEYEFDVEVRPEFELPDYRGLRIRRPVHDVTDEDVDAYLQFILRDYGTLEPHDGPAAKGDYVTVSARFFHNDRMIREIQSLTVCLRPVLRFRDAEISGFDELMEGARPGETREVDLTISEEAFPIEMRAEPVHAEFTVKAVQRMRIPEMNREFLDRFGVESDEELRYVLSQALERHVAFEQRQKTRQQVLEKITESANWELPEELVAKQVENALRREILEMQQAGFSPREIRARENELRQRAITVTRQAIKEHFVLDKIAEQEGIDVTPADIDREIRMMAEQSGENPRKLRAKLQKSGLIENLEAQIRERKTVEFILEHAEFEDVPLEQPLVDSGTVEAVDRAICETMSQTEAARPEAAADKGQTEE